MALFDRSERAHSEVARIWRSHHPSVLTSDYVFDETVTVLKARVGHQESVTAGEALLSSGRVKIEPVGGRDRQVAWDIFRSHDDKPWSFTDCTSKVLVDRLRCEEVWALDVDFRQMGSKVRP